MIYLLDSNKYPAPLCKSRPYSHHCREEEEEDHAKLDVRACQDEEIQALAKRVFLHLCKCEETLATGKPQRPCRDQCWNA